MLHYLHILQCLHFLQCPLEGLPSPLLVPFYVSLPWSVDPLLKAPEAVEAHYHSFIQSLRTSQTRPLLGVLSLWREDGCVVSRWIANTIQTGYRLQFHSSPPPYVGVLETTLTSELHTCTLAR